MTFISIELWGSYYKMEWIKDNVVDYKIEYCEGYHSRICVGAWFEHEEDATMFKLVWS